MKRLLTILPLLSLLVTGCYDEPIAEAVISPNPAWVGEDITFTNLSHNTEHAEWVMGDGTTSSSFNVVHYYNDPGLYNVTLRAFGRKGDVNVASFAVDVTGSELTIVVKEFVDEYFIEGASVVLFASLEDWDEADYAKAVDEQFTNYKGECYFEDLSYQRYYVDVYYQVGNEGYVNWLLGQEDVAWIETQLLPGGYDHTFIAYVDFVTFNKKSAGRPAVRPPLEEVKSQLKNAGAERSLKENKFSVKRERK
jgi:hypothetical protein